MYILSDDDQFRDSLYTIKIKVQPNKLIEVGTKLFSVDAQMPKIILYAIGKSNAQYILDTIFKNFKNLKGSGLTPAFNKQVTSLIFYTQGDRNDKIQHPEFFKKDSNPNLNKIYYDADYLNSLIPGYNKKFTQKEFELKEP